MASLVATISAVADLLEPLVADGTLAAVVREPQGQIATFPTAEVRFGDGNFLRNVEAGMLERQDVRTGIVRIFIAWQETLAGEAAQFAPIIDAIDGAFRAAPDLGIGVDRFDATGYSGIALDEQNNYLIVDVRWSATDAEIGTFLQDY